MVTELVVQPLVGIGDARLGKSKGDLVAALGAPERIVRGKTLVYFGSALRVHLDRQEVACFVEVAGALSVRPVLDGVYILEISADNAMRTVSRYGAIDTTHREYPMTCIVRDVELSLWRQALPGDDSQMLPGARFESIGVGRKGYFEGAFR